MIPERYVADQPDQADAQAAAREAAAAVAAERHARSAARGAGYEDGDDIEAHEQAMGGDS